MARLAALVCLFGTLAMAQAASEFEHATVESLGADVEKRLNDGRLYLTKWFAPCCGHCKRLTPTMNELGDLYMGDADVVIAHIDCTVHGDACAKQEIRGYPTLKLFYKGKATKYEGARDTKSLAKFIDEHKKQFFKM